MKMKNDNIMCKEKCDLLNYIIMDKKKYKMMEWT